MNNNRNCGQLDWFVQRRQTTYIEGNNSRTSKGLKQQNQRIGLLKSGMAMVNDGGEGKQENMML